MQTCPSRRRRTSPVARDRLRRPGAVGLLSVGRLRGPCPHPGAGGLVGVSAPSDPHATLLQRKSRDTTAPPGPHQAIPAAGGRRRARAPRPGPRGRLAGCYASDWGRPWGPQSKTSGDLTGPPNSTARSSHSPIFFSCPNGNTIFPWCCISTPDDRRENHLEGPSAPAGWRTGLSVPYPANVWSFATTESPTRAIRKL